jgi:hypothetical protein
MSLLSFYFFFFVIVELLNHADFADPTGQHCIINLSNQETFYLNTEWTKPKPLIGKEKMFIECIAWV